MSAQEELTEPTGKGPQALTTSVLSEAGTEFSIAATVLADVEVVDPQAQIPPDCPVGSLPSAGTRYLAVNSVVTNQGVRADDSYVTYGAAESEGSVTSEFGVMRNTGVDIYDNVGPTGRMLSLTSPANMKSVCLPSDVATALGGIDAWDCGDRGVSGTVNCGLSPPVLDAGQSWERLVVIALDPGGSWVAVGLTTKDLALTDSLPLVVAER